MDEPWTNVPPVPDALQVRIRLRGRAEMQRPRGWLQAETALVTVFSICTLLWAASAVIIA